MRSGSTLIIRLAVGAVVALLALGLLPGSGPAPLKANPTGIGFPAAAFWGDGRIDVFASGTDDAVWHKYYARGQGWSGWESLGGDASSGTAVSSWSEGRLDVFAVDYVDGVWHKYFARGQGWSGWESLGGHPPGSPLWGTAASSWAEGRLDVFITDEMDYKLRHKWYVRGDGWSGWEDLGKP